jgi:hypothetical protein
MLQLQIAMCPRRDIPPDISDQISPEVAHTSKKASKTGKFSVAILKIAECPQSDFFKCLEQ